MSAQEDHDLALKRIWIEAALGYARLFLTTLITVSGGGLLALIAFGAQVGRHDNPWSHNYSTALLAMGLALVTALLATMFAYFNQFCLAFMKERPWLLWLSWAASLASVGLLAFGSLGAYFAVVERVGP